MKKANLIVFSVMVCFAFIAVSFIPVSAGPQQGKNKPEYPIKLPKTGQIESDSAAINDDGALQIGVAWPDPRFTDNGNGTVTDNLTGLIWLKNANCFGDLYWYGALAAVFNLESGQCGLSDNSIQGDWRVPNRNEFLSIIDVGIHSTACWDNTALPCNHPFVNYAEGQYWTSTTAT